MYRFQEDFLFESNSFMGFRCRFFPTISSHIFGTWESVLFLVVSIRESCESNIDQSIATKSSYGFLLLHFSSAVEVTYDGRRALKIEGHRKIFIFLCSFCVVWFLRKYELVGFLKTIQDHGFYVVLELAHMFVQSGIMGNLNFLRFNDFSIITYILITYFLKPLLAKVFLCGCIT